MPSNPSRTSGDIPPRPPTPNPQSPIPNLDRLAVAVVASPDRKRALGRVLRAIRTALDADLTIVHLIEGGLTVFRGTLDHEGTLHWEDRRMPVFAGGTTEECLRTRRSIVVPDTSTRERMHPQVRLSAIGSTVHVPILLGPKVIGTMHAGWHERDRGTPERVARFELIARRLAVALAHLRQRVEAERRSREQEIVTRTAGAIAAAAGLDEALRALLAGMRALTAADLGGVRIPVDPGDLLGPHRLYFWQGRSRYVWRELCTAPGSNTALVLQSGRGCYTPELAPLAAAGDEAASIAVGDGVQSSLIVPLRAGGQIIGTLHADAGRPFAFSEELLAPLQVLADHAGGAVVRTRLDVRRRAIMEQFANILADVGAAATPEAALEALLRGAVSLLRGDEGTARMFDDRPGEAVLLLRLRRDGTVFRDDQRQTLAPGSNGAALRAGSGPILIRDFLALDPRTYPLYEVMKARGYRSSVNVPIDAAGHRIGSLHVTHQQQAYFGPAELAIAEALAAQAGAAIARARLVEVERSEFRAGEQAREALERSEARFRSLVQNAADVIAVTDMTGDTRYVSPSVEQLIGSPPEDIVGVNGFALMHPEDIPGIQAQFAGLLATPGARITLACRVRHRDGSWRDVEGIVTNLLHDPSVAGVVFNLRDVTDRKRAAAALERQYQEAEAARGETRAILDATSEGMVLLAPDGRVLSLNRRFEELFEVEQDYARGLHAGDLRPEIARLFGPDFYDTLAGRAAEPGVRFTMDVRQHWPQPRELELYSAPVPGGDGSTVGRLFAFRDVTREREADRMKTDFVSLVSHELRTPLTSIKGYVDLLLQGDVGELSAEQQEFLDIVKNNADRLVSLINDLLDISRIEAGKIDLKRSPLELAPLLGNIVASLRPQLESKRQQLALDLAPGLPPLLADADRLTQVLMNLLSNAHKYTPAGGRICVRAEATATMVRIAVRDTGVGMSEAELTQLFTKFFRANNRVARDAGGTGLGLAITRSLVELHGGQISVESTPGKGSTFTVTFPASQRAAFVPPARRRQGGASGRRVLVVDDEPDVAHLIRRYLERGGYTVQVAHSGADALRLARQDRPHLITLDVLLPGEDGFAVLARLKADAATANIPVVLLSIVPDDGRGTLLGAVDYVTKPVREAVLLQRVDHVLAGDHTRRVLLADDDADTRALLAAHLRSAGYQVLEAGDGEEAVTLAQREQPGLLLMDLQMPRTDGISALRRLRAEPRTRELPVIMLAGGADASAEHRSAIEELGGLGLLCKPCTAEELALAIGRSLGGN